MNNITQIPCPKELSYRPYQEEGIKFIDINTNILLADVPGLGKTIQAIGYINLDTTINKVLVICPAIVKINWERECRKWLTRELSVQVLYSKTNPNSDIIIVNYDILYNFDFIDTKWDLLIVDESHRIKNKNAKRTKYIMCIKAKKKLFLTGTPILNKPVDLWTTLQYLDYKRWRNKKGYFSKRYCNGKMTRFGWDESGATNTGELNHILKSSVMLRREKKDVLKELPPKIRQLIELPLLTKNQITKNKKEREVYQEYIKSLKKQEEKYTDIGDFRGRVSQIKQDSKRILITEMSKIRHETSVEKIPFVVEHIKDCLEEEEKIVVFAHHRDIVLNLHTAFEPFSTFIVGGMDSVKKQKAIDLFQESRRIRLLFGSIQACGVGINLTASNHIIFVEPDWTPANMIQAEDRCHRRGQLNSVLIQYFVFENSIDSIIVKTFMKKQETIEKIVK